MYFGQREAGVEVNRREVLDYFSRAQGDGQGVYLDEVSWLVDAVASGLSSGVGSAGSTSGLSCSTPTTAGQEGGYALHPSLLLKVVEDTAYGTFAYGTACRAASFLQGQPDGPPSPGGVLLPWLLDLNEELGGPVHLAS